jgi:hypothetical protein
MCTFSKTNKFKNPMKESMLGTMHKFTSMVPKPSATLHPDIKNGDF